MENKNIINMKRQIHELTSQHNKLTLLCKMLYSNIKTLSTEVRSLKGGNVVQRQNVQHQQVHQQRSQVPQHQPQQSNLNGSLNDLQADEILQQLQQQM